ncbi:MAG: thymidine phosphorylase [Gammaproteobacteria bacterium]
MAQDQVLRLLPHEAIRLKRDGGVLTPAGWRWLAQGIADGSLADAQVAALAMAVWFQGMTAAECAEFTLAMRDSGLILDWKGQSPPGPILDKHSTGGIGDLVSLPLAPMLAACGAWVPSISGRGLSHTGGTLDKLESIPGYCTQPDFELLRRTMRAAGVAIIGASERIAPADRRLYAIRDVTATVDSIPLIVASILSKKLAGGLDALVLDVKTGNGAVLPDIGQSRELARQLVATARAAGLSATALITDMSQPLARSAGNALEVREAIAMLRSEPAEPRLLEVTLALGAAVLVLSGSAANEAAARAALARTLADGSACERFARMVAALGGPADLLERPEAYLPSAPVVREVRAGRAGFVTAIDTRALGLVVVALGGGRTVPGQAIDHAVGLDGLAVLGTRLAPGDALARVHAATPAAADQAAERVASAYTIGDAAPSLPTLVEHIA